MFGTDTTIRLRHRGLTWAPVLFLLAFLSTLGVVAYFMLLPLMREYLQATPEQQERISASTVLLGLLLILIVLIGLIITLRLGRWLRRLQPQKRQTTKYTDAWSESARRMPAPSAQELEEQLGSDNTNPPDAEGPKKKE